MLRTLGSLRTEYTSDVDDIATDFINPCLAESCSYDRITGFFSSSVFHLTHGALATFFTQNHGRMRLLCSPRLSNRDADSLLFGYSARGDSQLLAALREELDQLLRSPELDAARLLGLLVASDRMDIRLARVTPDASHSDVRMFHDKVGVFVDEVHDLVGFRGSSNESYLGLSSDGNIESVDVWPSWEGGRDARRVRNAVDRFQRLWEGTVSGVTTVALPGEIRKELERIADDADLETLLRSIKNRQRTLKQSHPSALGGIKLRKHQRDAVLKWQENEHRGLLAHATGSGKTVTGLFCANLAIRRGMAPLILVPSSLLATQWMTRARELLGAQSLIVGAGDSRWQSGLLRAAIENSTPNHPYVAIAVLNSACKPAFRSQVGPLVDRLFVIVDESHRIGSPEFRTILEWLHCPWRLGLSATPERAGDPIGTQITDDYFAGIIHNYTLKDALDDGVLSPYSYYPSWVRLSEDEEERWDRISRDIQKRFAIAQESGADDLTWERLKLKLIERARIAKTAAAKIPAAANLVADHYRSNEGQRWLVYCDNQSQLKSCLAALKDRGIRSWEYHSSMAGDPEATLKAFNMAGGVIVAIRCLDEGIDIPAATHAMILASSQNPREFIQRRGRILRRAPGKGIATLLDVLVLPDSISQNDPTWALVASEVARSVQFASWAIGQDAISRLEAKWVSMGLPLSRLDEEVRAAGFEPDDHHDGRAVDG